MEIQIGVAKINKYASSESGDTLEVIERPNGGLSVVMADGQRSGKSAKRISNMVVRKVVSLLAEGVRDGPAARAASDYLYSMRNGKVLATLNILSVDLETNTIVLSRNNPSPTYLLKDSQVDILDDKSKPVGIYRNTKPIITEHPIIPGLLITAFTDGIPTAGERKSASINIEEALLQFQDDEFTAQDVANHLVETALDLDDNRPIDDISVVVIKVIADAKDLIRRMSVYLPI